MNEKHTEDSRLFNDHRKGAFNIIAPEGMPMIRGGVVVSPETHNLLAQSDESGHFLDPVVLIKGREYCMTPGESGRTVQLWEAKP